MFLHKFITGKNIGRLHNFQQFVCKDEKLINFALGLSLKPVKLMIERTKVPFVDKVVV